ncbi:MAG TPA: ribbon-helix-helix protein, CopG family [Gemmatimonadaceae bacterium]|nr:ribbon-helix-helix protein, CopG family [Gemmatimonadaceae bacterium]
MSTTPRRVREPVQAYLESDDAELLASLAERMSVSKAEVIRQGIRRLAQELELAQRPGAGLSALVGSLDAAPDVPTDLAARHDEYLYAEAGMPSARLRRVSGPTRGDDASGTPSQKRNARGTRRR